MCDGVGRGKEEKNCIIKLVGDGGTAWSLMDGLGK